MNRGTFNTVARGLSLPAGWGFPPAAARSRLHPSSQPDVVKLRAILFPSEEDEMLAQLVRWHFAVLRSRPHVWRSLATDLEGYEPCGVFKHAMEGEIFKTCPDPSSGYLTTSYQHRGETRGLIGALRRVSSTEALLSFAGWSGRVNMQATENAIVWQVTWPSWLETQAAFVIPEEKMTENLLITFRIRPLNFDVMGMLQQVSESCLSAIQGVGLLDSLLSAVKPLDKLAVVWLALAMLEERWDALGREGNEA